MINQRYGIVQGRLVDSEDGELQSFPNDNWEKEFEIAKKTKLSFIELLAERKYNPKNPIWSDIGRNKIRKIAFSKNLQIVTSCYDYIIENNIFRSEKILNETINFIEISKSIGCDAVILPFLEKSEIGSVNRIDRLECLKVIANHAKKHNLKIFIESLVDAMKLKEIISDVNSNYIKCVFDTGNRVALSYSLGEEIRILNSYIGHVHIKDKNKYSENVLLGRGMVDFFEVFEALNNINYKGDFVFETVRGKNPIHTAKFNIRYCEFYKAQIS